MLPPARVNIDEAAQFFLTSRVTIYKAIKASAVQRKKDGLFPVHLLEEAINDHCPRVSANQWSPNNLFSAIESLEHDRNEIEDAIQKERAKLAKIWPPR